MPEKSGRATTGPAPRGRNRRAGRFIMFPSTPPPPNRSYPNRLACERCMRRDRKRRRGFWLLRRQRRMLPRFAKMEQKAFLWIIVRALLVAAVGAPAIGG